MISVRFLLKKLKGANYQGFIDASKRISKVNGKPWLVNLADCLYCTAKYGSGHVDYETFEMYALDAKGRENILTISKNNSLVKMLNVASYRHFFEDKIDFNTKFNDFVKRDWLAIDENSFDKFVEFIEKHDRFIAKPIDQSCGRGIGLYEVKDYDAKDLFNHLIEHKCFLLEEVVVQSDEMKKLAEHSVNTTRVVTILNGDEVSLVAGCVRMGRGNNVVDNFNAGGISGIIDASTGVIVTRGIDRARVEYLNHPDTGTQILGFQVPMWDEVVKLVTEAAKVVPEVRYVGWDVAISRDYGPLLIEGNSYPGQDAAQYPKENLGTYSVMMNAIK